MSENGIWELDRTADGAIGLTPSAFNICSAVQVHAASALPVLVGLLLPNPLHPESACQRQVVAPEPSRRPGGVEARGRFADRVEIQPVPRGDG